MTDENKNPPTEENNDESPFPGFNSVEEFVQDGFKNLVEATKLSNRMPAGKSRDYYEACPSFHRIMREQEGAVLLQLSRVMRHAGCKGNIQNRDQEDRFDMVVDANDLIFERVGTLLDELAGIRKNPDAELAPKLSKPISGSWNRTVNEPSSTRPKNSKVTVSAILNATRSMDKPQLKFPDKIDNSRNSIFTPLISYKYNILKPLALLLEDDGDIEQYSHPYEFELMKWSPDDKLLKETPPTDYLPVEETTLMFVTEPSQVDEMLNHLRTADVIAIDLEHHSYRSFQGFTCLLQISTRQMDFVVDTLLLRGDLQPLNEVFTDPKKLKIFHGALSDIQWLQRDLSLYIVGMFDTHIAARVLNYPRLSLAFLLQKFCNIHALKHFQLADWRIRPLPEEMILYAREDTHYLIYIYENMRNELLTKANGQDNLLRSVFGESSQICLTRYIKPVWRDDDYLHLYHKSKRLFDNRQLYALQHLYDWRDKICRELDESTGYVLPNHMLLHIAETLPREVQGILACCNPVPPIVRQNLTPVHLLVRKAREQPLVRPVVEATQQIDRTQINGLSMESPLRCPHDLTWLNEFRPDLPVLLTDINYSSDKMPRHLIANASIITVYNSASSIFKERTAARLSPYQRYKLVKSYAQTIDGNRALNDNKEAIKKMEIDRIQGFIKSEKPETISTNEVIVMENSCTKDLIKAETRETNSSKEPIEIDLEGKDEHTDERLTPRENGIHRNPYATSEPLRPQKKGKKRKRKDIEESLTSYDYSSVDYSQFQTASAEKSLPKQGKFKAKHKKRGNKKIKIAI